MLHASFRSSRGEGRESLKLSLSRRRDLIFLKNRIILLKFSAGRSSATGSAAENSPLRAKDEVVILPAMIYTAAKAASPMKPADV